MSKNQIPEFRIVIQSETSWDIKGVPDSRIVQLVHDEFMELESKGEFADCDCIIGVKGNRLELVRGRLSNITIKSALWQILLSLGK